ncbi:SPFH domain / Band 7 family protein [Porphyromonadaceae bacterium KH3CP3RA]|nr:SPFH domain / Band 7 family protein [Porphyromonadaceae bacterium KH3CP3RA]
MMKRVKVEAYKVGLVVKNGSVKRVLDEGAHWLWGGEVKIFDTMVPFRSELDLDIVLKNEDVISRLEVITVKENQLLLVYENSILKEVYITGRYAFWKGVKAYEFLLVDTDSLTIDERIPKSSYENAKLRVVLRKFTVGAFERGLLLIDNQLKEELKSGTYYFWNNSTPVEIRAVDLRVQQMEISGQELLSKDKATLRISFFVKYQVDNIRKALIDNKEYDKQLYVLMQLVLRGFVGALTLDELLTRKDTLSKEILNESVARAEALGVKVLDAGVRDIILPGDMKEIMNQVLVAEKKAQANIIMRREETASVRSMLNTAKLMEENEMLWKLKEMEYVEKIADKIGEITISGSGNIVGQLKDIFSK